MHTKEKKMTAISKPTASAGPRKESSDNMSALAARVLEEAPRDGDEYLSFNALLQSAKRLAGSVLSPYEHNGLREPSAGTTAYEMIAAMETANLETTETLINMVAATVLMKIGGPRSVSISPADMDAMYRAYDMTAKRDGMITTVSIMPRPNDSAIEPPVSLYATENTSAEEPQPQAEGQVYVRPVWAISYHDKDGKPCLASMHDRRDAERHVGDYGDLAAVENRCCLHPDCPAEHCNRVEVTSDS